MQALIDLVQRRRSVWRPYGIMLITFAAVAAVLPLYNAAVTGSPWTNTYALWWSMDRIGFGPGIGVSPEGHNLQTALLNFRLDFPPFGLMWLGWPDVIGVSLAWLPLLAGLLWPPLSKARMGLDAAAHPVGRRAPVVLGARQQFLWPALLRRSDAVSVAHRGARLDQSVRHTQSVAASLPARRAWCMWRCRC